MTTTFMVHGDPAAQGSKRIVRLRSGKSVMIEQSTKVRPWRAAVAEAAQEARCAVREGDVSIRAVVFFVRPAGHFGTKGQLKSSSPIRPGYIDVDKAARAILDALAGVAYHNDRQVAALSIERMWAPDGMGAGAVIQITAAPLPEFRQLRA